MSLPQDPCREPVDFLRFLATEGGASRPDLSPNPRNLKSSTADMAPSREHPTYSGGRVTTSYGGPYDPGRSSSCLSTDFLQEISMRDRSSSPSGS